MKTSKRIVILGGGISGLATAFYLSQAMRKGTLPHAEIRLLEATARLGGVIRTESRDGFLLEYGPDSFTSEKPAVMSLCHELGIEDQIIGTRPEYRGSSIYDQDELQTVPEGFAMLAPIKFQTLLRLPLLSWKGKLRLAMEPWVSPGRSTEDQSLGDFVLRRFGREVLERIAQPMLGNIYGGNLNEVSLLASMPRLREMEQTHGSIGRALYWKRRHKAKHPQVDHKSKWGMFLSFKDGMETLVRKLVTAAAHIKIQTSSLVKGLELHGQTWKILLERGASLEADALCLAIPGTRAAELLRPLAPELAASLEEIRYRSMTTLHVGVRRGVFMQPFEQYGFMISPAKAKSVLSVSVASNKFVGRAPSEYHHLRIFAAENLMKECRGEERLVSQKLWEEATRILSISEAQPTFSVLTHYAEAIPRYGLGHLDKVAAIESRTARIPGLFLTGNAFRGVGISDCVRQAEELSSHLVSYLERLKNQNLRSDNAEPFLTSCV